MIIVVFYFIKTIVLCRTAQHIELRELVMPLVVFTTFKISPTPYTRSLTKSNQSQENKYKAAPRISKAIVTHLVEPNVAYSTKNNEFDVINSSLVTLNDDQLCNDLSFMNAKLSDYSI